MKFKYDYYIHDYNRERNTKTEQMLLYQWFNQNGDSQVV